MTHDSSCVVLWTLPSKVLPRYPHRSIVCLHSMLSHYYSWLMSDLLVLSGHSWHICGELESHWIVIHCCMSRDISQYVIASLYTQGYMIIYLTAFKRYLQIFLWLINNWKRVIFLFLSIFTHLLLSPKDLSLRYYKVEYWLFSCCRLWSLCLAVSVADLVSIYLCIILIQYIDLYIDWMTC